MARGFADPKDPLAGSFMEQLKFYQIEAPKARRPTTRSSSSETQTRSMLRVNR